MSMFAVNILFLFYRPKGVGKYQWSWILLGCTGTHSSTTTTTTK